MAEILEGKTYDEAGRLVESCEKDVARGELYESLIVMRYLSGLKDHRESQMCVICPWKTVAKLWL
jgi:NifU-like protein involved in Fe-S cluster formation